MQWANILTLNTDCISFFLKLIFSHNWIFLWNILQFFIKGAYSCPNTLHFWIRERWKEPPSGSEIEHETVSSQAVGGESDLWPHACWRLSQRLIGSGLVKGTHRSCSESESSWGNCHYLWTRTWVIYPWPWWSSGETKWMSHPYFGQVWGWSPTLGKVGSWSPPGLPNVQSSTARPKTPRLEVFLVSLERSRSVDAQNGLALVIWTSAAQVMGKRRAGSQTGSLTPDH